ncbi:hypothetical protein V502_01901 [Pseudogymnoascus sp. VKM F-4520 (FW-2644)]|nr:hypothetical protein V502_01901 [Pseudogymnoascus sp. VKM F-4520 (FW-2644)]
METIQPFVRVPKHFNSGITFRIYDDRELAAEQANMALEAVQCNFEARERTAIQERRPMEADIQQVHHPGPCPPQGPKNVKQADR